ncbi:uncharacterized protein LOC126753463 isoform X2 [Bactrocera neohumeralis]|uniref:uncharacterized protein LOC126753463 isoform X2 n=1 Tax=Bactrocera neohumeralis TaxID=98809 RepID=UPI002165531C|nr:uncharacterized protein LOC126753463 isoform X2 [Bactrocera neohumeralis]
MSSEVIALIIINEVLAEEEEQEQKRIRKKRKWCKMWLQNKNEFSNNKLLKTLRETEPKDYKNYMRMSDEVFYDLLLKVKVFIEKEDTIMREAISAENRLAITLRFLATGNSFEDLKFSTAISAQAIGKIVIETCKAIIKVLKDSIKLPKTPEQWMAVADQFYEKSMFPNCLGALDGKHINISRPSNSGSFYFNYKKTFSIVLLAIVDSNSNFLMVDVCRCKWTNFRWRRFRKIEIFQKVEKWKFKFTGTTSSACRRRFTPFCVCVGCGFRFEEKCFKTIWSQQFVRE